MWQRYSCHRCGYTVNAGDRYCGNCGINLRTASAQSYGSYARDFQVDQDNQETIRRNIGAYRKLYLPGNKNAVSQNNNSTGAKTGGANETPIRSEIIRLLSGLLNN